MARSSRPVHLLATAVFVFATGCTEAPAPPPLTKHTTPVPEEAASSIAQRTKDDSSPNEPAALSEPSRVSRAKLASTPGAVRWTRDLGAPITFIRWTPLKGLIVSAGSIVHNVTSRSVHRWRFVAGARHELFDVSAQEVVWSPEFSRLNQLKARGREGWARTWNGTIVSDQQGGVYLLDAGTVAALGPDGRDRWRASPEGIRELEGPFLCRDGSLFHGMSGMQRVAVRIGDHGSVLRETPLGRGAVLIGAAADCEPLVWLGGEVKLLSGHGEARWSRPVTTTPIVQRARDSFVLLSEGENDRIALDTISDSGQVLQKTALPVSGSLTAARVLMGSNNHASAIGLCLGVTSPCSKPVGTRGPFNTLITSSDKGVYRVLLRHVRGHLDVTGYPSPEHSLLTASSADGETTDLTLRAPDHGITWQTTLSGRLSAGPYVGPSGEVYVGTCRGFDCESPHLLISITGQPQETDE